MSITLGTTIGAPVVEVEAPLQESAYFGGYGDPDSRQADFAYFRPVGAGGPLDLSPLAHERMIKRVMMLYRLNPLAFRIVQTVGSFATGNIRFSAEDPRIQKILTDHWNHPLNRWDMKAPQCGLELGLFGEVFLLANITKMGDVTWGDIDPTRVKSVIPDEKDLACPGQIAVSRTPTAAAGTGDVDVFDVIRYDGKPKSDTHGMMTGEVLFTRTNFVRGALRGVSDLFPLVDYLDGLDQFMFALQQRASHQNNWIWDVTLMGATETEITKWLLGQQGKVPTPGTIRAHNDKVVWQALAPNFAAEESTEHFKLFRNYITGAAGLADWIMGDMSSANRAATESSAAVVMKTTVESRQKEVKAMIEDVFNFVIDQKIIAGALPTRRKTYNRTFYVTMPEPGIRDLQRMAAALRQSAEGIAKMIEYNMIEPERAYSAASEMLNQLDLEGSDRYKETHTSGDRDAKSGTPVHPRVPRMPSTPRPQERSPGGGSSNGKTSPAR